MTRLIDADALRKEVRELPNENTDYIYLDLVDREVVQTLISEAPTVERPQWVPCSERLPDRLGDYLVSDKYGDVYSTNLDYLREGEKCFG